MVEAVVLIAVPALQSGNVVKALKEFPQVTEAAALWGEMDVFARVSTSTLEELEHLVMSRIQALPHVQTTRTFIFITGQRDLYWERPEGG